MMVMVVAGALWTSAASAQGAKAPAGEPLGAPAPSESTDAYEGYREGDVDVWEFRDDDLLGAGLGGDDALIVVRPKAARSMLLRPRVQFVPELLKSVENL